MMYTVTEVIDGDTFEVSPSIEGTEGTSRVRIANYNALELPDGQPAKLRLENLIFGHLVRLEFIALDTYGRAVCNVFLNGRDIVPLLGLGHGM